MSSTPWRCPACGSANRPGAGFCLECGAPSDGRAPATPSAPVAAEARAAERRAAWSRPEVWVGVLLGGVVLGGALLDWWQQDRNAAGYRAAQAASARHDWDATLAAWTALGDYRDARQQAHAAAEQVRARDSAYQAGKDRNGEGNWIGAATAFSTTVAIQPGYRDAPALLTAAQGRATNAALGDVVIVRLPGGPAPGLYLPHPDGSRTRLPGSDGLSQIWTGAAGQVIYDGPIPHDASGSEPTATPSPTPPSSSDYNPPLLAPGRQLLQWSSDGAGDPPLVLPAPFGAPTTPDYTFIQPTIGGAWRITQAVSDVPSKVEGATGIPLLALKYYGREGGQVQTVLDGSDEPTYLGDFNSLSRGWLLLRRYHGGGTATVQTEFLLAGPGQLRPQTLITLPGLVPKARLSPDGRYVLYDLGVPHPPAGSPAHQLWLLDVRAPQQPARLLDTPPAVGRRISQGLDGRWVPDPGQDRLVLHQRGDAASTLTLYDVATGEQQTLGPGSPVDTLGDTGSDLGEWLVPGLAALLRNEVDASGVGQLVVQPFDSRQPAVRFPLPPARQNSFYGAQLSHLGQARYLVYRISESERQSAVGNKWTMYSLALDDPAAPLPLYQNKSPVSRDPLIQVLPGGVVAVTEADGLHLWPVDGSPPLPLLPGVDQVWELAPVYAVPLGY